MAILLTEARAAVKNAVLHAGGSFNDAKIDYALIETGERFINETGLNRTLAYAPTVANSFRVNVASTTADFSRYDLIDTPFLSPGYFHFTTATYNNTGFVLTVPTGTLDGYNVGTGDTVVIASGTGATAGTYTVSSATSTTITLSATAGTTDATGDWVGTLYAGNNSQWGKVIPVGIDTLRAKHETHGTTTGAPEFIAWADDSTCWLFPIPDEVYTLNLPYAQPLTTSTWTPGCQGDWSAATTYQRDDVVTHTPSATAYTYRSLVDGANLNNEPVDNASTAYWQLIGATSSYPCPNPQTISLNVHKKWAIAWIRSGVKAQMLSGAPGHPDAAKAAADFERLISRVEGIVTPGGVWFSDGDEDNERQYGPDSMNW